MTAFVSRVTIYPIKSLDGVPLSAAESLASGALVGDRRFALADANGELISAKRAPWVHQLRTDYNGGGRRVTLRWSADQATFDCDHEGRELAQWVGQRVGQPLKWLVDAVTGFPDDLASPGPTLVSEATLETVASWFAGMTVDSVRRRFRANLEIGGVPTFWEDRLYPDNDRRVEISIGTAAWSAVNPCQRCVVPSRDPESGEALTGFARFFSDLRRQSLPAWAIASHFDHYYRLAVNTRGVRPGRIQVGDAVSVVALL